jgi:hypothetical protein
MEWALTLVKCVNCTHYRINRELSLSQSREDMVQSKIAREVS